MFCQCHSRDGADCTIFILSLSFSLINFSLCLDSIYKIIDKNSIKRFNIFREQKRTKNVSIIKSIPYFVFDFAK